MLFNTLLKMTKSFHLMQGNFLKDAKQLSVKMEM